MVKSILVKLETSCTVILPPTMNDLWFDSTDFLLYACNNRYQRQ